MTAWKPEGTSGGSGARLAFVSNEWVSQSKFTYVTKFSDSRFGFIPYCVHAWWRFCDADDRGSELDMVLS